MSRIVDLSLPLSKGMRGVQIEPAMELETDGWNATHLKLYSHAGTHMDAPRHFLPDGATIDAQPLEPCCGPALVVNLAPAAPRQVIGVADLAVWHNQIQAGTRLLMRTDWCRRFGSVEYRDALPRISVELAGWLADRQIALLGVEPPSVADVHNLQELTQVHRRLLAAGIVIVEGLANLDALRSDTVHFIALPLKVTGGDATPVRAIAIEGDSGDREPAVRW